MNQRAATYFLGQLMRVKRLICSFKEIVTVIILIGERSPNVKDIS